MTIRRIIESDRVKIFHLIKEFKMDFTRGNLIKGSDLFLLSGYLNEEKSLKSAVDELFDQNHITLVAEDGDAILGYISGIIKNQDGKKYHTEGYIDEWFLSESHRNKGVGKKLYENLIKEFKNRNCTHLGITAYIENKKAADFYKRLGFKEYLLTLKKTLV